MLVHSSHLDGRLLRAGRVVRMMSNTSTSVIIDSTNQPVRNWATGTASASNSPNVTIVEHRASTPNTTMKRRMRPTSQRRGRSTSSGSTRSVAMVIAGRSVRRLRSRICFGSIGRNGHEQRGTGHAEHVAEIGAGGDEDVLQGVGEGRAAPRRLRSAGPPGPSPAARCRPPAWRRPRAVSTEMPTSAA